MQGQTPPRAPNFGKKDEPEGSWPLLEGWPREPSKAEEKALVKAAKTQSARNRNAFSNRSSNLGRDTDFAGDTVGGGPQRLVTETGYLIGFECMPGSFGEACIGQLLPIFSFERTGDYAYGAIAREGYAVGSAKVRSQTYINAVQLIFLRIKDDGSLDSDDSYLSDWIGYPGLGQEHILNGEGKPVIGIHKRQGLVVGCLALVIDDGAKPADR